MEGAGIGHHPFNREVLLRRLLARPFDHLWRDIPPRDLVAKLRHAKSHASSSTCQIQQWSTKRPRTLLVQGIIVIIALVYQIIGLRISKFFKRIIINHHCPFRALLVRHRIDRFSEKYTRWGADSPGEGRAIRILQVNFPLSGHLPSRRGAIGSALGNGTPLFSISLCSHEGEGPGPFQKRIEALASPQAQLPCAALETSFHCSQVWIPCSYVSRAISNAALPRMSRSSAGSLMKKEPHA